MTCQYPRKNVVRRRGSEIDATGTHRRIQALMTRGWTQRRLHEQTGMSQQLFSYILLRPTVSERSAAIVKEAYDRLWDQQPPSITPVDRYGIARARAYAAARRWLPPLAWDDIDGDVTPPLANRDSTIIDEIAVELACSGEQVRLTPAENCEAVRRLHALHFSDGAIASRLPITERTVLRIRQRLGLPAAVGFDQRILA